MRLIQVETLKLEEFVSHIPPYAILSHTWGAEEVTFSEIQSQSDTDKAGWRKILLSCKQARDDGYRYVWCDTCCIDKSSSAELSESINSMFRWYAEAEVCYSFLEDVQRIKELEDARWFTRGWTLQELIAPKRLTFYNTAWGELGTREELATEISERTGVDTEALHGASSIDYIRRASFAKKMAWAANRNTTRDEDVAYCLLGLLEINMSLLYGEGGTRAFTRLQEECIRLRLDQSFLTWLLRPHDKRLMDPDVSFLAGHPKYFRECSRILITGDNVDPFSINNKGLQIRLPILQDKRTNGGRSPVYLAVLACYPKDQTKHHIGIPLHAVGKTGNTFVILPSRSHRIVDLGDFLGARSRDCCILRSSKYSTGELLSINSSSSLLQSWSSAIFRLNNSKSPSIWDPLVSEKVLVAIPDSPKQTSYGILLHPPPLHPGLETGGIEKSCLKVLVRVDIGIEKRDDVNVSIQEFYIPRGAHWTDPKCIPSIPTCDIRTKSRSKTISLSTQQSETLAASASWILMSNQSVLFLDIVLTAANQRSARLRVRGRL